MNASRIAIRSAAIADITSFNPDREFLPSIRAVVAELDGMVIALGGLALVKGRWIGFLDLKPEARPFKMHIMRGALRFLEQARSDGIRFIYIEVDDDEPKAETWVRRLGFEPDPRSPSIYRWKA